MNEQALINLEKGDEIASTWASQWLEDVDGELAFYKIIVIKQADGLYCCHVMNEHEDGEKGHLGSKVDEMPQPLIDSACESVAEEFPEVEWKPGLQVEFLSTEDWQRYKDGEGL